MRKLILLIESLQKFAREYGLDFSVVDELYGRKFIVHFELNNMNHKRHFQQYFYYEDIEKIDDINIIIDDINIIIDDIKNNVIDSFELKDGAADES